MSGRRLALALALGLAAAPAGASEILVAPTGALFTAPVKSMVDLRYRQIVRQQHDLSCGAAALATVLRHYYGEAVAEQDVIDRLAKFGDAEKVAKDGFSMLELKRAAEEFGFVASGFRVPDAERLRNLKQPAITLISTRGYSHFVVIKGVLGDKVSIADPAFGHRLEPIEAMREGWSHVLLVVVSRKQGHGTPLELDPALKARPQDVTLIANWTRNLIRPGNGEY
jgi:uncharacterized protein